MSGEGMKITLSSATPEELKVACKRQAGQIKVLKETLQKSKAEIEKKESKEEESAMKIKALNQCVEDLSKQLDSEKERLARESEKKLEIWKTRAKDKITQLEEALREAREGQGQGGNTDELKAEMDAWKVRAKEKIQQLEKALKETREANAEGNAEDTDKLKEEMESWKTRAKESMDQLKAEIETCKAQEKEKTANLEEALKSAKAQAATAAPVEDSQKVDKLNADVEALKKKTADQATALGATEAKVASLTSELAAAAEEIKQTQADAGSKAKTHQQTVASLEAQLMEKISAATSLEAAVKEAAASRDAASSTVVEMKSTEDAHKQHIATLENQLSQCKLKIESLEAASLGESEGASTFAKLETSYKAEITSLTEQLQTEKVKVQDLETSVRTEQTATQELKATIQTEKDKVQALEAKVEDLSFFEEMQGKDNSGEIENLENELRKATTTLALAQNECNQLKEKNRKLEQDFKQHEKLNDTLKEEVEVAKKEAGDVVKRFEIFKTKAKEQSVAGGLETEEKIKVMTEELERYKKRSNEALNKRGSEVVALKEQMQTAEGSAKEYKGNCERLTILLTDREDLLQGLQNEVETLRNAVESSREESRMLESRFEAQFEEERRTVMAQHQVEGDTMREVHEARVNDMQVSHERELAERCQQNQEALQRTEQDLKVSKEMVTRVSEEKEREMMKATVLAKELRKRIEELENSATTASVYTPARTAEASSPVNLGSLELGRDMMLLAQQQANRDWELQKYQDEIEKLSKENKQLAQQRDGQLVRLNSLSSESMARESSENRTKVNMDYLKNIFVKFMCEKNKTVQAGLVPVVVTMLELSQQERALIKKEFPGAKV